MVPSAAKLCLLAAGVNRLQRKDSNIESMLDNTLSYLDKYEEPLEIVNRIFFSLLFSYRLSITRLQAGVFYSLTLVVTSFRS